MISTASSSECQLFFIYFPTYLFHSLVFYVITQTFFYPSDTKQRQKQDDSYQALLQMRSVHRQWTDKQQSLSSFLLVLCNVTMPSITLSSQLSNDCSIKSCYCESKASTQQRRQFCIQPPRVNCEKDRIKNEGGKEEGMDKGEDKREDMVMSSLHQMTFSLITMLIKALVIQEIKERKICSMQ